MAKWHIRRNGQTPDHGRAEAPGLPAETEHPSAKSARACNNTSLPEPKRKRKPSDKNPRTVRIIVCIKQVPETSNVRMDEETGTMVRKGVESIVNPLDLYAVETAIRLKEEKGGTVTALSMGPPSAEAEVREAVSMGCDDGMLLTDRRFAGSDTRATSYCLSRAVERLKPFDLVLTGLRATDGETGQVGPGIAAFLGVPLATYVSRVQPEGDGRLLVDRGIETGYESLRMPMPCVLTVAKEIAVPRLPTLRGKQRAKRTEIPKLGPEELEADPEMLGLSGSPTRVVKIDRPRVARKCRKLNVEKLGVDEAARRVGDYLEEKNLL